MIRTVAPAIADRHHPHSRSWRQRLGRWFYFDPPLGMYKAFTVPKKIHFWINRFVLTCWRWRDISPGPLFVAWLWTWGRIPRGIPFPALPLWLLAVPGFVLTAWSIHYDSNRGHTANKDRTRHRDKRRWEKACLDAGIVPIPDLIWSDHKPHVILLRIAFVEGTDDRSIYLKASRCLDTIYGATTKFHAHNDGTATISVRLGDPLADEPTLPAYLNPDSGLELPPAADTLWAGIDQDGEPYPLDLFQQNVLIIGQQRSGKSSTELSLAITAHAAPDCEVVGGIDPQGVSLGPLRAGDIPIAKTDDEALHLLEDFHASMQKREIEMDELGTSLAHPSDRWPLRFLFVDETLNFIDPVLVGKPYAEKFKAHLLKCLRTGPKTGHVIVATVTDPRADLLTTAIRNLFSVALIFKVRDLNAAKIATGGSIEPGYEPHKLPGRQPGRCILQGHEWRYLRTYRTWDAVARKAVASLSSNLEPTRPVISVGPIDHQSSLSNTDTKRVSADLSSRHRRKRRDQTREDILAYQHTHPRVSAEEVADALNISPNTVRYWWSEKASNPIPVRSFGSGVYGLVG